MDPEIIVANLRKRFKESGAAKSARVLTDQRSFRHGLESAIVSAFAQNALFQRLQNVSDLADFLSVRCGNGINPYWFDQFAFGRKVLPPRWYDSGSVPCLTGTGTDKTGRSVLAHAIASPIWTSDTQMNVLLLLVAAKQQESTTWKPVCDPKVRHLENGHIGDATFIAMVSEAAKEMAELWAQAFASLTDSYESQAARDRS